MARIEQVITAIALVAHVAGCQTESTIRAINSPFDAPIPNTAPNLWADVRNEIERLERSGAPLSKWKESSESNERVTTILRLHEITESIKFKSEPEKRKFDQLYSSGPETYHFGFEGNFHALVFFDASQNPMEVLKW